MYVPPPPTAPSRRLTAASATYNINGDGVCRTCPEEGVVCVGTLSIEYLWSTLSHWPVLGLGPVMSISVSIFMTRSPLSRLAPCTPSSPVVDGSPRSQRGWWIYEDILSGVATPYRCPDGFCDKNSVRAPSVSVRRIRELS